MRRPILLLYLLFVSAISATYASSTIKDNPQVAFAFEELQSAAPNRSYSIEISIDECLAAESYKMS